MSFYLRRLDPIRDLTREIPLVPFNDRAGQGEWKLDAVLAGLGYRPITGI
jgi:hypothetical protein